METKQKPVKTIKVGGISASIFSHVRQSKDNSDNSAFISKNVQITKSYYDGKEYKTTNNYDVHDLPKLVLAASKAYDYIMSEEKR